MTSESEAAGFFAVLVERLFGPRPEPPKVEVRPVEQAGALYPRNWQEFVGQKDLVRLLRMEVESAKATNRPLAHLLFYGPPGTGKSAAAHVLAAEMGAELYESTGPEFPDQTSAFGALDGIVELHKHTGKSVLWLIDEVDGMARSATYALHGVLCLGYATWQGQRLYEGLPVSIIGTSNFLSGVPGALKSRMEPMQVSYYPPDDLATIARQSAVRLGINLTSDAAAFIGANAAGEPRRVNIRLLRVVRNMQNATGAGIAGLDVARKALQLAGLRPLGLTKPQFDALEFIEQMPGRTAGLSSVGAALQMGPKDVMSEVEGYLIYKRLLLITPRGRTLSLAGLAYLEEARKEMATWVV